MPGSGGAARASRLRRPPMAPALAASEDEEISVSTGATRRRPCGIGKSQRLASGEICAASAADQRRLSCASVASVLAMSGPRSAWAGMAACDMRAAPPDLERSGDPMRAAMRSLRGLLPCERRADELTGSTRESTTLCFSGEGCAPGAPARPRSIEACGENCLCWPLAKLLSKLSPKLD
eukprot:761874-Pleurochrysis_carterae.AAC.1